MSLNINLPKQNEIEKIRQAHRVSIPYTIYEAPKKKKLTIRDRIENIVCFLETYAELMVGKAKKSLHLESEKEKWARKVPEIDWDAEPAPITPQKNFDTAPLPMQTGEVKSVYSKTYTSFSGIDAVAVCNGEVIGELQEIDYEVDGELKGDVRITGAVFDESIFSKLRGKTLITISYLDEYGHASYQVIQLNKLKSFYTKTSVDEIAMQEQAVYDGELLVPLKPAPMVITEMSDEVFGDMVAKVYANCTEKEFLPEPDNFKNHLANRVYFYYLYKNYCKK